MGLRIIDRKRPSNQIPVNPDDAKKELETLTLDWMQRRGSALPLKGFDEFIERFREAKHRVTSNEQAQLIVQHMSAQLKSGWSTGFRPHQKVDVATLLVLL